MSLLNEIKILYENENFLAIDKPSGLLVHADGSFEGLTVVDWVLKERPDIKGVGEKLRLRNGEEIERPGIVHRLDAETSGVLVIAKNQEAFLNLKNQFKKRNVSKVYNALVYGHLKNKSGSIDRPIGKSNKDFRAWSAQRGAKGKLREAVTEYEVLKEGEVGGDLPAEVSAQARKISFLEVRPKTGRTHQIRVHFKAIHHPVVCDPLYAPNHDCFGFSRLMLHANKISFKGLSGETVEVESPLPEEFQKLAS